MKSIGEPFSLLFVFLKVGLAKMIEESKVRKKFYGNLKLQATDKAIKKAYRGVNPYRISKKFLLQKGEKEVDVYGETPLTSLEVIAKECNINSSDQVLEIGCGRGRGAFFLSQFTGCSVIAVDWIPYFINVAKEISTYFETRVSFRCDDILDVELNNISCVYLCGTCFSDHLMHKLARSLENLSQGSRVISVSFPLTDFSSSFAVKNQFSVPFFWGDAEIYLQERI